MDKSVSYYSMRRFAPYQGTVQLVEGAGFRAFSHDGIDWQIQIRSPGVRRLTQVRWSATASDLIDTELTREVIGIMRAAPKPPFSPTDTLELWLLGRGDALPLALLRTLTGDSPLQVEDLDWRPGTVPDLEFVAPSLGDAGTLKARPDPEDFPHAEVLSRCVRAAADPVPRAQWFRRGADGSGVGVGGMYLPAEIEGRTLPAAAFPELLLRETWQTEACAHLVGDYHAWMSPSLLTHATLSRATRARLEVEACGHAERLYVVRELLPEIIDQERIDTALVEAVIRRTVSA